MRHLYRYAQAWQLAAELTDRLGIEWIGSSKEDRIATDAPPYPRTGWANMGGVNDGLNYSGMEIGIPAIGGWKIDLNVGCGSPMAEIRVELSKDRVFWLERRLEQWQLTRLLPDEGTNTLLAELDLPCPPDNEEHLVLDRDALGKVVTFIQGVIDWECNTRIEEGGN